MTTTATTSATADAAAMICLFAGKDYNTVCSRSFEITLFEETLAKGEGFKTRQAAGKAGQKVVHKLVVAMLNETPEARKVVKLAIETRALANAKRWGAWAPKAEALKVAVAELLAA